MNEALKAEVKELERKLEEQRLTEQRNRLRLELDGDPLHPKSEGWEWDGDLGIWEQRPSIEHIDL